MDIKFSGSDAGGFQFAPNAAPKPKRERKPRKSIGSKGAYSMEAWDVYKNGVFQYTEYSIYVS